MPALHLPEDGEAREHVMWGLEPSGCAHGVRREEERQQAKLGLDARACGVRGGGGEPASEAGDGSKNARRAGFFARTPAMRWFDTWALDGKKCVDILVVYDEGLAIFCEL